MLPRAISSMNVTRMLMVETGRYNPMYQRPYETNINNHALNAIADRIMSTDSKRATGSLVSGIASSIAAPSSTPGQEIQIQYGWSERRIRFVMEVEYTTSLGGKGIYYIQGYTSHPGVSMTGAVDPYMQFIVNSFTAVNRVETLTPYGVVYRDIISDTAQVFAGADGNIFTTNNLTYGLRPHDVYLGMQSAYLAQQVKKGEHVSDGRYVMNGRVERSRRANNVPAEYLSKILDSYMVASDLLDFGQGNSDLVSRSIQESMEPSLNENIFFQILSTMNSGIMSNSFNWAQLQKLDPQIDAKTKFIALGEAIKQSPQAVHDVGMTEYWTGSNLTTQFATILSNAIPALMMDHMLQRVQFRSTNHDIGGQISTVFVNLASLSTIDPSRNAELFKHRFETELIRDITMGNQISYMIDVSCDLFGETWISIAVDNEPMVTYTVPSFCDALYAPVLTTNRDHFSHVTSDLESLVNYVTEEVSGSKRVMGQTPGFTISAGI